MESCLYKTGDKRSSVPGSSTGPSSVSNITRDDLPISKTGHDKYNLAYDKLLYELYEPFLGLYKYTLISFALWIRSLQSRVLSHPPTPQSDPSLCLLQKVLQWCQAWPRSNEAAVPLSVISISASWH